ncbi:MAG: hypothetical protein WGN25_10060 [Candidatus Electrothrix sp. GW3-4]|uniref:hypothetical protein n=1 Tax=Candidatus Electrothrix sp. GW3-4 TaxID=3126740 RepID=UPI0030CDEE0F
MTEAKKRDFVTQIITLVEENQEVLTDKGFDPTERVDELKNKKTTADTAEIEQQEAAAKAKEATAEANRTLDDAYNDASDFADLISGLLGKDDELVKKMRKFRK